MAGKGSRQRPTDTTKYESNWDRIFGAKKVQVAQGLAQQEQVAQRPLTPEPGMSTSSLEDYRGQPNAHAEGSEAPNE